MVVIAVVVLAEGYKSSTTRSQAEAEAGRGKRGGQYGETLRYKKCETI